MHGNLLDLQYDVQIYRQSYFTMMVSDIIKVRWTVRCTFASTTIHIPPPSRIYLSVPKKAFMESM